MKYFNWKKERSADQQVNAWTTYLIYLTAGTISADEDFRAPQERKPQGFTGSQTFTSVQL